MLTMSKNESSKLWQEAFCDSDTVTRHCFSVLAQTLEEKGRHRQDVTEPSEVSPLVQGPHRDKWWQDSGLR